MVFNGKVRMGLVNLPARDVKKFDKINPLIQNAYFGFRCGVLKAYIITAMPENVQVHNNSIRLMYPISY